MNTSQLKSFAQEARSILLEGVGLKLQYWGFNEKGEVTEEPQSVAGGVIFRGQPIDDPTLYAKWRALKQAVSNRGVRDVIEEATYTWFNRFMAIRILSKNAYEAAQVEYSSKESKVPEILTRARRGQYDFLSSDEKKQLDEIITDYSRENDAFGILIKGYCHSHPLISRVFGNLDDFTELLLPDNILSDSGFIHLLNTTEAITDEDYRQVELIGWLYQFYISKRKDEVFASFKKKKKAEAADIPAATQIFTPNWIVKYMVQNTVGKLWLDLKPDSGVKDNLKHLVENESANANPIINEAADIKLLDPAVGSGHILVEGFDILYECFLEEFYTPQEAVETILTKSLYGLDLDKRAMQLARFAVLLKAAKYYPEIIQQPIMPKIYAMPEGVYFSRQEILDFLGEDLSELEEALTDALKLMYNAKNLGSIMQFELNNEEREKILQKWKEIEDSDFLSMNQEVVLVKIRPYLEVLQVLTQKYESVVANPPYMGQKSMNADLKNYVNKHYPLSKSDLFAVFMEVCLNLDVKGGLMGMINQHSWMFLSSYEKLRVHLLENYGIHSMLHLGPRTFEELSGEVVQSTAFVFQEGNDVSEGAYHRLVDFRNNFKKESNFLNSENLYLSIPQINFSKIPGSPIAYWASDFVLKLYTSLNSISKICDVKTGLQTGSNNDFLRFWPEVSKTKISFIEGEKWYPYNKGGGARKWYGQNELLINWENDGQLIREHKGSVIRNSTFYFKKGYTWSTISSGNIAFRYFDKGFLFDTKGSCVFVKEDLPILPYLNSNTFNFFLSIQSPTLDYSVGNVSNVPYKQLVDTKFTENCVSISKKDWDSLETSWDFEKSALMNDSKSSRQAYQTLKERMSNDFFQLHQNEEELNRIFIEIYGLQDELDPYVPLKDITILQDELDRKQLEEDEKQLREQGIGIKAKDEGLPLVPEGYELPIDRDEVMRQFISYVIGCWMGRYHLDKPGLAIAHPKPSEAETAPYSIFSPLHEGRNQVTFHIREDAIIPLIGSSGSFTQDATKLVPQFLEYVWGDDTFTENINFLEECLDKDLEKYLVKDFWKDHCSRYKKRPIYWLFSSEKGAFQVLVYMHRMNRFTVEKIRSEYLLPHMKYLQTQIDLLTNTGQNPKALDKMIKDLDECETYDLVLKDKADQQIEFDLDNGVEENYKLFEGVVAKIK